MSFINVTSDKNTSVTLVSNNFIKNYMPKANENIVKVYLYVLMLFGSNSSISIEEISESLDIFETDVIKSLRTLNSDGIISFRKDGDGYSLSFETKTKHKTETQSNKLSNISLDSVDDNNISNNIVNNIPMPNIDINQHNNAGIPLSAASSSNIFNALDNSILFNNENDKLQSLNLDQGINSNINTNINSNINSNIGMNISNNEKYSNVSLDESPVQKHGQDELDFVLTTNNDLRELISFIEETYGNTFTPNNLDKLVTICEAEYVNLDCLKTIVSYVFNNRSISKINQLLNALEAISISLNEKGIITKDAIENYLTTSSKSYTQIMKHLGLSNRMVSESEKNYIDKWLYQLNIPLDLVLEACDKTMLKINKPGFGYIDAILKDWKTQNVTSIDDINRLAKRNAEKGYFANNKQSAQIAPKSKFANFEQEHINYDELEKLNTSFLIEKYSGR